MNPDELHGETMKGLAMELSMLEIMMYVGNYMDMNDMTSIRHLAARDLERMATDLEISVGVLVDILGA
jgi:hypothetical protein